MKSLLWSSGRILNIVITNPDFLQTSRYPYLLYLIVVYFACSLVIVPTVLRKVTTFLLSKVMITIFSPKCSCNFLYISPRPACTVSAHSSFLTLQACYCSPVHHIYVFKKHCFPRGRPVKCDGRKRDYDVILVRTKDFEYKIQQICKVRNEEWAETVRGRLDWVCTRSTCCRRCVPPSVQCQLSDEKTDSEEAWEWYWFKACKGTSYE